jgi:nitroimidazol reductase NimA-like FMN-containing flavoprotein (pyridoxamine 5'-phosphate oxidase superfamily)
MSESRKLPQVIDLGNKEIKELLERANFGHLGLSRKNRPYVIPIHFAYAKPGIIYFFTTEGLKTEIIDENSTVCLQVEDVKDPEHWQSVIVIGTAVPVTSEREREKAMKLIMAVNPKLVPAWSIRWLDDWVRSMDDVVFRIEPEITTGRSTVDR